MSAAFKYWKGHQDHSNWPTDFTAGTKKNELYMKNVPVPYWILKWQINSRTFFKQQKHAKRRPDNLIGPTEFNYVTKTDFYM